MSGRPVYFRPSVFGTVVICFLMVLSFLSSNSLLTCACVAALVLFMMLLWRRGEPPILLFAISTQWAQATLMVFYADLNGTRLNDATPAGHMEQVAWLCLLALIFLAIGMRCGISRLKPIDFIHIRSEAEKLNIHKLWAAYLVAFAITPVIQARSWDMAPGLTQILLNLTHIKWAVFFLLVYCVVLKKRHYHYLFIAIALEIITGLTGFFAGFKDVFFIASVALATVGLRITFRRLIGLILLTVLFFHLSVLWTVVKIEYRDYMSEGTRQQVVLVSFHERLRKLMTLLKGVDRVNYAEGITGLVNRVAQTEMFSYVLEQVPDNIPFENGRLWQRAVQHIFMPRLLFPNKLPLPSDSEVTNYYTGLHFAGEEEGTSIALGYVTESYIDFGIGGMCGTLFFIGLLWGLMYTYFISRPKLKLFSYATSVAVLVFAYKLEVDNVHLLGGLTMGFIVMALALRFIAPVLNRLFLQKQTRTAVHEAA